MLLRFPNLRTALILLISVIALFLFPAPRGSFVSTHGPMTFLRSCWEGAVLWFALALASRVTRLQRMLRANSALAWSKTAVPEQLSPPTLAVLRI